MGKGLTRLPQQTSTCLEPQLAAGVSQTARPRGIARRRGMLQYLRLPGRNPKLLCLRHRVSTLGPGTEKKERNVSP